MVEQDSYVIVAIPEAQDPVWKYSSEKVPHMTLLYLDSSVDDEHVAQYLQHVAQNTITPFYASVDHRGPLGDSEADVLFFKQQGWSGQQLKGITDVRGFLLQDNEIKKAYDAVEQFPVWTPHLTMGYPTSPAKPDDRDYGGFHDVNFDRIALWTGNFDGPEFQLTPNEGGDMSAPIDVAWAEKAIVFLAHHGVKGQKWGFRRFRKDNTPAGETTTEQKKPGTKITVKGGKGYAADPDAVRGALLKQKAKNSTTDSLSNKDLQELVNRMNLEQQYTKLATPGSGGKKRNYLKEGNDTVNTILTAKKNVDLLMNDPLVKASVQTVKTDLGLDGGIDGLARWIAKNS